MQNTQDTMSIASIDELLIDHDMSLKEIFEYTRYTPETAYPQVVAQYYSMRSLLRVANRFGDVDEANFYSRKILEVDDDWFALTKGKMPLDTVEYDNPQVFQQAIKILEES